MIEVNMTFNLRVGGESRTRDSSLFGGVKKWFEIKSQLIGDFITYLKNDDPINYRITYDEGHDAYMILYSREFPEGFYHHSENKNEWFHKTYDANRNSIAVFSNSSTLEFGTVNRMDGYQMVPTEVMKSKSIAEVFLTNCAESNIDPYIPLSVEFDGLGNGYTRYGRYSKFEVDPSIYDDTYEMEIEGINDWLNRQEPEEYDPIHIDKINQIREMTTVAEKQRRRRRKRVQ